VPRLARPSAGRSVRGRARRLSGELLLEEQTVLAKIESAFVAQIPVVQTNTPKMARNLQAIEAPRFMDRALTEVMDAAQREFADLTDRAVAMTMESLHEEFALCERTLSTRYVGIAADSLALTQASSVDLIATARKAFETSTADSERWYRETRAAEMRASNVSRETPEQAIARMLSPDTVRLPGHVGRGLWWRTYSQVGEACRAKEIWLVNAVRSTAMDWFNSVGEQRR
jgi:hypothetical protein